MDFVSLRQHIYLLHLADLSTNKFLKFCMKTLLQFKRTFNFLMRKNYYE